MAAAYLLVNPELLRKALHLPDDCEIIGNHAGDVRLTVDHPSIPPGALEVSAVFKMKPNFDGFTILTKRQAEEVFKDSSSGPLDFGDMTDEQLDALRKEIKQSGLRRS